MEKGRTVNKVRKPMWPFLLLLILVFLVLSVEIRCAKADEVSFWNSPEKLRIAYHATSVADYATTVMRDPTCMSEGNWFLPNQPSNESVLVFKLVQSLAYEGIYHHLKDSAQGERLAFARVFFVINLFGPVNNTYVLSRGC